METQIARSVGFIVISVLSLIVSTVSGESIRIHNANDLINFSNNVNSGSTYSGTTVYLDSDIDFNSDLSRLFTPIGNVSSTTEYFKGTIDGQGHIISNLILSSSSQHVGLLGYSLGTTIKNVVIDESCTITSFCSSTSYGLYIGSVLGQCISSNDPCTIANVVNMGDVYFNNDYQGIVYIGGIAGYLETSYTYSVNIINCVNYGTVTSTKSVNQIELGGIAGCCGGSTTGTICNIQNCINQGNLINQGSALTTYIGGIIGYALYRALFENCVNAGTLTDQSGSIGGTVGYVQSLNNVTIVHCLSTGSYDIYGTLSGSTSGITVTNSSTSITFNSTIMNELNEYSESSDEFNKWILNPNNSIVSFNINGEKVFSITSQLVLLPDLVGDSEHTFSGWFNDSSCTNKFNSNEIISDTTLYGGWGYTVTFDFNNGTTLNETVVYGKEINFPEDAEREGYTFNGWNNSGITRMPGHDITFTANWTEITQISFSSSDRISSSSSLTRGISHLSSPSSSPSFSPSSSSSKNDKNSISSSSTQIPCEYVEIVFSKKDMSEKEVKEIIDKYTENNTSYEMKITKMDDGTTNVIIKFVDIETATSFIENIKAGSDLDKGLIKKVDFITESIFSFSLLIFPLVHLFYVLF